jgi:hypothetical protein
MFGGHRVARRTSRRVARRVCVGSPTWWLKTSVPIRAFLKSDAAGVLLHRKRFAAASTTSG